MVHSKAVYKFVLDNYGATGVLETDYKHPRNLRPYHTVEKAFYGRDGVRGLANLSDEAKARYQQCKESYNDLINLLKEHNLHRSIIPVKKDVDTTWISFQPAGVKLDIDTGNPFNDRINYTELFSYDIFEEVIDHENVYDGFTYRHFGIQDEKQVKYSTDMGEFRFLNHDNTVNLIKLLAQMRERTQGYFEASGVKMTHQNFADILVISLLSRDGWLKGSPKSWVKYMAEGFNINEIIFAFNRHNLASHESPPIPAKVLKDYMGLPLEWTRKLLKVGQ